MGSGLLTVLYLYLVSHVVCDVQQSSQISQSSLKLNSDFQAQQSHPEYDTSSTGASSSGSPGSSHTIPIKRATISTQSASPDTCTDDFTCLLLGTGDKAGLEAIKALHHQLDDDANGNIDLTESAEFLREELQYEDGSEKRQKVFHSNDDTHISVKELWDAWLQSEVHNWTVEQTVEWLEIVLELPQYVPIFVRHNVDGTALPRLAVSNMFYLSQILGIKDPIHKQKIAVKAMDVVLFGPPKEYSSHTKDMILVALLLVALAGCWYATRKNKQSNEYLQKMLRDMESLVKAEQALVNTQKELEKARMEHDSVANEKQTLEQRLLETSKQPVTEDGDVGTIATEVSKLKAEVEILRSELLRAEVELEDKCWVSPPALQHWLQLTYELELKNYNKKKALADKQLRLAREACEKLKKKRSSFVGAFVTTHGKSVDDVDKTIVEARVALTEITHDLQERAHRWKQIEMLTGASIIVNPGLTYLETLLSSGGGSLRHLGTPSVLSESQDDLDDASSIYTPTLGSFRNTPTSTISIGGIPRSRSATSMHSGRAGGSGDKEKPGSSRESSHSDGCRDDEDLESLAPLPLDSNNVKSVSDRKTVSFGNAESSPSNSTHVTPPTPRRGPMLKSLSHDAASSRDVNQAPPKALSLSESTLLLSSSKGGSTAASSGSIKRSSIKEKESTTTDTDRKTVEDGAEREKKNRKKTFFQGFSKRSSVGSNSSGGSSGGSKTSKNTS